ncbi:MAG: efflux RND transporter periplasmic adaptor subunit [Limisphaerales bacterium]
MMTGIFSGAGPSRTLLKVLPVVAVAAFIFFRVKLASVPVLAHQATNGPLVAEVMGTGTLEARVKTTLSPRIQERLAEVLVDQNDPVKMGQLLARLDDGELRQQVAVAEAALAAAKATVDRVKADEARAQAVLEQARLAHQRAAELGATRVASQADLDKAVELLNIADADLRRSRAAIAEAESQVVTADQNRRYQTERLGFTQIVSPYDGLVIRRDRDPGGVVVPGSSLLQIISTNELWISAWVDETAATRLNTNQPVRVVFRSEPARPHSGEVARLGRETDRETREFLVDVRVHDLPAQWTIGQRAEVFIETGRKPQALIVPSSFLQWREGKPGVFLNQSGKARWRPVTTGLRGMDAVEIVDGLVSGDQVVRPEPASKVGLEDGQRLRVK